MWADLWRLPLDLALLLLGYWLVDLVMRQGAWNALLARLGLGAGGSWVACLLGVAAAPFWSWSSVPEGRTLRVLGPVLVAALAWRATTRDIDVVTGDLPGRPRLWLWLSALGAVFSPAPFIAACVTLSAPFGMWQHHATLPMRVLQALIAYLVLAAALAATPLLQSPAGLILLVVTIQLSHYLITALAKGFLGPRWYSWVTDNRLHHIAASAYSWGWARFVPWPRWRQLIETVRRVERPLQVVVFAAELLAPLALLHPVLAIAFSLAWAGFHVGVFALSGLLFWEWILTDVLLAVWVWQLPAQATATAFGVAPLLMGLVVLAVFPLRHKLWKPMPLGWWDTPFTQRMHWVARGESGRRYGLYANFMDPHERIYGKVHGCFMTPVPVLTYHLGEAWRYELRDGLREAASDPARLEALRARFGVTPRDAGLAQRHRAYLERFCWELNHGARKRVLPRALRWLKAPGGQCYYWGELPAYRRQEPIAEIEMRYREEIFDSTELRRLRDESVMRLAIDSSAAAPAAVAEPTPKEIDDLLLSFAAGRLIRLPGFGGGYVRGDDGKPGATAADARASGP